MCDFTTATPKQVSPAPNQRVNYPLGLVLGADEFEQEQTYFLERSRLHNRAQHGYGTVCGLNLTVDDTQKTRMRVSPGLAIDPRGRVIVVCKEQCGDVDKWLSVSGNRDKLGTGSGPFSLYVTLCYRECLTNKVPIPGAPCRSEEDTLDYSRVTESFCLEFHPTPPPAVEVDMVRSFAQLLARIQITDVGTQFLDEEVMAELMRGLLDTSPVSSPPAGPLLLKPADAGAVMRTAFRIWVNEVRPVLHAQCDQAAQDSPDADCILLGRVEFEVTLDNKVATGLTVDSPMLTLYQEDRPFLLHTQLIQELMLEALSGLSLGLIGLAGDVTGTIGRNTVERIRGTLVAPDAPAEGQVMIFQGGQWQPAAIPAIPLAGDVTGTSGNSKVQRLRGRTIAATVPVEGQVLVFSNRQWRPYTPPYSAIAAGTLSVAGNVRPVFGAGLKLIQVLDNNGKALDGLLAVHFTGYRKPTNKTSHTYIVKAMAIYDQVAMDRKLKGPMVSFRQFDAGGIQIWVTDEGEPVSSKALSEMKFMIEVNQYQAPLAGPKGGKG